jgi:DNA-binding NarL/FixJ family response regulator
VTGEASLPGGQLIRVFLTDDVDELRLLLRLGLEDAGDMTVVGEAGDGAEAVEQAGQIQPDVMLLDLSMPIMDGLEAIPLLRERVPGMKIVVVSGFAEGPASERAIELGADRYVSKTADINELHEIVREVMRREGS